MKPPLLEDNAHPLSQDKPPRSSQMNQSLCWGGRTHLLSAFIYSCSHSFSRHFLRANYGPWAWWGNARLGGQRLHQALCKSSLHVNVKMKWTKMRETQFLGNTNSQLGGWEGPLLPASLPSPNNSNLEWPCARPYAKCFRHINSFNTKNNLKRLVKLFPLERGGNQDLKRYWWKTLEINDFKTWTPEASSPWWDSKLCPSLGSGYRASFLTSLNPQPPPLLHDLP